MRYTRYNYKAPKKKNNFTIVLILTIVAAIALGTALSKLIPKDNSANTGVQDKAVINNQTEPTKEAGDASKTVSQQDNKEYVAIQCGVYSKKENALTLKNNLAKFGTPFIIEEDNLNRVMLGIYPKESIDKIVSELQKENIEFVKINFQLIGKDATSAQINAMISADIEILNKLSEKDTQAIQTVEFKKWLNALEGSEESSESFATMTEIKTYLNALPEELKRDKSGDEYIYIYKFIKKLLAV